MNSSRHHAREIALQILYGYDSSPGTRPDTSDANEISQNLIRHFNHFQVPESLREFTSQLVAGTLLKMPDLDALIEKHATNWKIQRMGLIDRNLLRLATYELLHYPETPHPVTLDEAVELAKQFGNEESPSFINGILDSILKDRPSES